MARSIAGLPGGLTVLLVGWFSVEPARAGCNTIPPASRTFPSTRGFVDRAIAGPRERVMITLRPECLPNPLPSGQLNRRHRSSSGAALRRQVRGSRSRGGDRRERTPRHRL
jgi:hypothetical protein